MLFFLPGLPERGMDPDEGEERIVEWPERRAAYDRGRRLLMGGEAAKAFAAFRALVPRADELPGAADRSIVLGQAAEAALLAGRIDQARAWVERALREARDDPDREAEALVTAARVANVRGAVDELSELATRGRGLRGRTATDAGGASLHGVDVLLRIARNDWMAAVADARKGCLAARGLPRRRRLTLLWDFAFVRLQALGPRYAERATKLLLAEAGRSDPPNRNLAASSLFVRARCRQDAGDLSGYVEHMADACRTAREAGLLPIELAATARLAGFFAGQGWYSSALRIAADARRTAGRRRELSDLIEIHRRHWIHAARRIGLTRGVRSAFGEAIERARARTDWIVLQGVLIDGARLALDDGELGEARRLAEESFETFRERRQGLDPARTAPHVTAYCHLTLAEVDLLEGKIEAAARRLASARTLALRRMPPLVPALADRLEAELELAGGRPRAAVARGARACAWARRKGPPTLFVPAAATLVRALAAVAATGHAGEIDRWEERRRRYARAAAWVLGWMADKLDAGHRRSFLAAPWTRRRLAELGCGLEPPDPEAEFRASPTPPVRLPFVETLDRAWERLRAVQARGVGGAGPPAAEADPARIESALAARGWSAARAAKDLSMPLETVRDAEARLLAARLQAHGGNVSAAATSLQIPQPTLHHRLVRYGIVRPKR